MVPFCVFLRSSRKSWKIALKFLLNPKIETHVVSFLIWKSPIETALYFYLIISQMIIYFFLFESVKKGHQL